MDPTSAFYATAGNLAKTYGIIASIIGIRGDNLNINLIGAFLIFFSDLLTW